MRSLLILVLVGISSVLFAQTPMTTYDSMVVRTQLSITMPEGMHELDIPFMHKIPHYKAVGPADSSFQVRYWIRPLDSWMEIYNKKSKKDKANSMPPNDLCKSMMMLAVLDVTNNKEQDYQIPGNSDLTKMAYNADWEALAFVESGWPQEGYKYCYIWCLHKDDTGDVFVYILLNKKEDLFKVVGEIIPTVKFK